MPSPTYSLHKFKNCVDPNEGLLVQTMVATLLDGMQSAFDEIEAKHLGNPLPYLD
jgi:hypothetical protein